MPTSSASLEKTANEQNRGTAKYKIAVFIYFYRFLKKKEIFAVQVYRYETQSRSS